jgi:hypothetical protein
LEYFWKTSRYGRVYHLLSIHNLIYSHEGLERRLEYNFIWSINPFVANPYQKQPKLKNKDKLDSKEPVHYPDSPGDSDMMTIQQVNVFRENVASHKRRRSSLNARPLNIVGQLFTPKASYAELFYDLFFVASLTSFGIKHEITQVEGIASYVAFFTVLWYIISHEMQLIINRWVWTSQTLYDVRFEVPDIIHRIYKFLQLFILGKF